jgi:hypothetical protein
MSKTPAQSSVNLVENQPFIDIRNARHEEVTLDSTTIDATNTPTTQLRKGLVVGYDSAGANYLDAADAAVDAHTYGAVTSAEAPDGDWEAETLTIEVEGVGRIAYVSGSLTTVSNIATCIADINNGPLGALVVASNSGGNLLLTAIKAGVTLSVTSSLATAYAAGAGVATTSAGALTKYGILATAIPSTLGINDTAEDRNVTIVSANAIVRSADLLGVTTAARQWFEANGIKLA